MKTTKQSISSQCQAAYRASFSVSQLTTESKNQILNDMADALITESESIIDANNIDIQYGESNGLSRAVDWTT